jgi:hypothetical protein
VPFYLATLLFLVLYPFSYCSSALCLHAGRHLECEIRCRARYMFPTILLQLIVIAGNTYNVTAGTCRLHFTTLAPERVDNSEHARSERQRTRIYDCAAHCVH